VLDSFLGSGTTLLAAERTGRICRGIELDPLYIDTAIRRWQNLTVGYRKPSTDAGAARLLDQIRGRFPGNALPSGKFMVVISDIDMRL
jgi:hypothetical protein